MPNSNDPIVFDPNLTIPFGLKDASYTQYDEPDISLITDTEETAGEDYAEGDDYDTDDSTDDEALDAPGFMEIVSQTIHTAPDGTQVVDVVLNIEDIDGAVKYDVRITK